MIFLSEFAKEFGFFYPWLEFQVKQADILPRYDEYGDIALADNQLEFLIDHLENQGYCLDKAEGKD